MSLRSDEPSFKAGREMRRRLFGDASVARLEETDDFFAPLEDYSTRAVFGDTWTRPGLTLKERSLITLGVVAALNRPIPVKRLTKCAIQCGATKEEIRETLMQVTMYIGVAGGVETWSLVAEALKEIDAY